MVKRLMDTARSPRITGLILFLMTNRRTLLHLGARLKYVPCLAVCCATTSCVFCGNAAHCTPVSTSACAYNTVSPVHCVCQAQSTVLCAAVRFALAHPEQSSPFHRHARILFPRALFIPCHGLCWMNFNSPLSVCIATMTGHSRASACTDSGSSLSAHTGPHKFWQLRRLQGPQTPSEHHTEHLRLQGRAIHADSVLARSNAQLREYVCSGQTINSPECHYSFVQIMDMHIASFRCAHGWLTVPHTDRSQVAPLAAQTHLRYRTL